MPEPRSQVAKNSRRKPTRAKQLGVTDDEYARLLAAQDGHCALCPNRPKSRRLHVDHDHRTGRVRGLLCHRCNRILHTWVTATWARRLVRYLDPPKPKRPPLLPPDLVTKPLYTIGGVNGQARIYNREVRRS